MEFLLKWYTLWNYLWLWYVKLQSTVHHKGKEGYYAHILIPDSGSCLLEVLYYSADISMPSQYNKLDANKDFVVMLMTMKAILKHKMYFCFTLHFSTYINIVLDVAFLRVWIKVGPNWGQERSKQFVAGTVSMLVHAYPSTMPASLQVMTRMWTEMGKITFQMKFIYDNCVWQTELGWKYKINKVSNHTKFPLWPSKCSRIAVTFLILHLPIC